MNRQLGSSILFLAFVLPCWSDTSADISLQNSICGENPIHGLVPMKFGYDIRSYTNNALEKARKGEIFQYTCFDNNSNYLFKKDKAKITFPDQFTPPFPLSKLVYEEKATFLDQFEEFDREEKTGLKTDEKSTLFDSLGEAATKTAETLASPYAAMIGPTFKAVGAIVEFLTPPAKTTVGDYSKHLKTNEYRASMNLDMEVYELSFKFPEHLIPNLSDDFVKAYKALPESFIEDPMPFMAFIERYGTHYIFKAKFGGRIIFNTKHSKKEQKKTDKEEIDEAYKVWMETRMNKTTESNKTEGMIKDEMVRAEVIGGDVSTPVWPFKPENMGTWEKSVYEDPAPIGIHLVPIIDLIADESIQVELAHAIVYSVNKQSLERYKDLLENTIPINNLPAPYTVPNICYLVHVYEEVYLDLYGKFYNISTQLVRDGLNDTESILTLDNRVLRYKISRLTIFYEVVKATGELWIQMGLNNAVHEAATAIHKIHLRLGKKSEWYSKDTGFGDRDPYEAKYFAAKDYLLHVGAGMFEPESLVDVNQHYSGIKAGNDMFLKMRTFDCDKISADDEKTRCFSATVCGVHMHMKGWRDNETLADYEDPLNVGSEMRALKIMLSTLQHRDKWEDARKWHVEDGWEHCQKFWWSEITPNWSQWT